MSNIQLTLSVEESYMGRYAEVVENCRRAGMLVERQLVTVGVITGTIDTSKVQALSHIAGVRNVEPSRTNRCLGVPPSQ
ncbi:hypothetical protein PT7_0122 [Pusillimonas sp. T7-7]|uniref:hypothetical protein n=1 Tax=Pusillimonas sp. (strain T7-7) TaxID=1007105 RepID=UPI00020845A4|nr:hypothetical protein [Pusillimonas sp. T7-7]AEC18662.1 hypothetical protein PT7_0122 [Pusillimonas sp. T7-7]